MGNVGLYGWARRAGAILADPPLLAQTPCRLFIHTYHLVCPLFPHDNFNLLMLLHVARGSVGSVWASTPPSYLTS